MPTRVLYLHEFSRIGGAERALLGLADAVRQKAVEPLVVWPQKDSAFTWLQSRGVHVVPLKVPSWRHGLSLPLLPLFLARLQRNLVPTNVDLVHVNNYRSAPLGQLVSRWVGVPCVCHVRELITSEGIRQYRLRASAALIAVADAVAHALVEGGVPQHRVTTVRSGIALRGVPSHKESAALRERLGITDADCLIGIVAHILPHKGYDDLVQALALIKEKVPNIRCLIVGEAPRKRYFQRLLHLAERLSVRDRLILVGIQDDVAPFLHALDLFVLPSRTEGLPLTILEAMAAGRPVVATAVGGIPEVVRDGETGILVPERDPRQLADAVLRLLDAPGLAKAMGEAGRKRIEGAFTLEDEARHTATVYHQVLAASSPDSA
ncbi:MAG: glycosyltransferase [candidate division NC10 bacterium]|nr:glycosyltransferase [candidate division NC10 bacterium]